MVDLLIYPSDIVKCVYPFRGVFGRFPRLVRPKTFSDWLQAAKLFRRKRKYIQIVDKLRVRDFLREKNISGLHTVRVYWSGLDLLEARKLSLPKQFVIKANNGSGTNLIVTDAQNLDWDKASELVRGWLSTDYSVLFGEWQYRWIKPELLIEEYLVGPGGNVPLDYKFFCFHGKVKVIQVDLDRFTNHTRAMMDRDFNQLPFSLQYPPAIGEIPRPNCLGKMLEIAEQLSGGEPFLRVDLYDMGYPVFGELTLHPEAGIGTFDPAEWDERLLAFLQRP